MTTKAYIRKSENGKKTFLDFDLDAYETKRVLDQLLFTKVVFCYKILEE